MATLDTHEAVRDLRSTGFTDAQAEAVARNIRKAQDLDLSALSTKVGLETVRTDLALEIEKVRSAIADTKAEIIKWVFGATGLQTVIILGGVVGLIESLKP